MTGTLVGDTAITLHVVPCGRSTATARPCLRVKCGTISVDAYRSYFVYIMANRSRTLYVGVTNDLEKRVAEHKARATPGFTARYNVTRLVYYEDTNDVWSALEREKELKG